MAINYSMCWEDPVLLRSALRVRRKDRVLVIASGGENAFALLLDDPATVVAIDGNVEQLHLVALKIAAMKVLSFQEFTAFLGFAPADTGANRCALYLRCRPHLRAETQAYWDERQSHIKQGVVHVGRLEGFLAAFRKFILPLVLSKTAVQHYLASRSLAEQRAFYASRWNTWRWRMLFRIFFSRPLLRNARAHGAFAHARGGVARHYLERAQHGITVVPVKGNYFVHYILTGSIRVPSRGHPYLDERNFRILKKRVGRIELVHGDVRDVVQRSSFDAYALSDIFEFMTQQEYESVLRSIAARSLGRLCYWNNVVPRHAHGIQELRPIAVKTQDRVFFYSRFIAERVQRHENGRIVNR